MFFIPMLAFWHKRRYLYRARMENTAGLSHHPCHHVLMMKKKSLEAKVQHSFLMRGLRIAFGMIAFVVLVSASPAHAQNPGRPIINVTNVPFDPSMLTTVDDGRRKEVQKAFNFAQANGRTKDFTAAIGPKKSWATSSDGYLGKEDRVKNVLQRCQHYEREPCALVAIDGFASGYTKAQPSTIAYPKKFSARTVPFIPDGQRSVLEQSYRSLSSNKAIAINSYGYYGMIGGEKTKDEAVSKAIQKCKSSTKENCFIYSVNDDVLFDAKTAIADEGF